MKLSCHKRPTAWERRGRFAGAAHGIALAATMSVFTALPANAQPQDAAAPPTPSTVETRDSDFPPLPDVTLSIRDVIQTDAEYIRAMHSRSEELAAQQSADPLVRAELLLAAANLTLAFEIEPACTRKFLGLRLTTGVDEAEYPRAAIERAAIRLREAQDLLKSLEEAGNVDGEHPKVDPARLTAASRRVAALTPFAGALSEYFRERGAAEPADSRDAASRLSPLLEDDDPRVAAAAGFWQSCLRASEPDPAAALARLDLALADVKSSEQPYAFFARMLRCRVLAAGGDPAAALALLLQMEERCQFWWIKPEPREEALRAIGVIRYEILDNWQDQFSPTERAEERTWCVETAGRLLSDRFEKEPRTVTRLSPAIPVLASHPEPAARSIESARDARPQGD